MPWLETTKADTPFQQVMATHPALMAAYQDFASRIWSDEMVDPLILELCRLRIALLIGDTSESMLRYQPAVDAGLTEEMVAAIPNYHSSPLFTQHQRDCLQYAELWVMDAHAVTDEIFAAAADGFTPSQMMGFVCAVGLFDGADRMRLMLGIAPAFDQVTVVPSPRPDSGPLY